jgi:SsrA-binding protein
MSTAREYRNKKAFHDYEVLEKVEAGMVLMGSEVKSIRDGKLNLSDAYARLSEDGELWLHNCHIAEYRSAAGFGHEALRKRKLLLHKLERRVDQKGFTLIPLRVFFSERGFVKVEIGLCKGKQAHDKRQAVKERETEREIRREMTKF